MKSLTLLYSNSFLFPVAIFMVLFLAECSEDEANRFRSTEWQLPSPEFTIADSVIILETAKDSALVKIFCTDTIEYYFTTDGSLPDRNSRPYDTTDGIKLGEGHFSVNVIAFFESDTSRLTRRNFIVTRVEPVKVSGIATKTNYNNPVSICISDPNSSLQYICKLNGEVIDLTSPCVVSLPDFYTLVITSRIDPFERTDTFLFVILDPSRNGSEWGLQTWIPVPFAGDELTTETLEAVYPRNYVSGINLPVILKTTVSGQIKPLYLQVSNSLNDNTFNIKRGIGSMNPVADVSLSEIVLTCGSRTLNLPVKVEDPAWTNLSGTPGSLYSGKNARIYITGNLTIPAGDTLFIAEGTIVAINEAVDINNYGFVKIQGTSENPIVFTSYEPDKYWGGFLSKGTNNAIEVTNAILCRSGYHTSDEYQWGHAQRQALFYLDRTRFEITNSYMLDHIGQVFYSLDAHLTMDSILVQRAKTSGQLNTSEVSIDHSVFTDFPDDSYVFRDDDNDALYISHCNADVKNSVFMFAKDDGIDSGEDEGGTVNINNCHFEATFHEGISLSSKSPVVRKHNITNCVVTNCGQGIELGFSSVNHAATIDNCRIYKNGIGLRYGDNYPWSSVNGLMVIKNTQACGNLHHDVWNMVHEIWAPKLNRMQFSNTFISAPSDQYPELPVLQTGIREIPE